MKIREIMSDDSKQIHQNFIEQGWNKPLEQFQDYVKQNEQNERHVLVATLNDDIAGYLTIKPKATNGPFRGLPEIEDFNVFIKFQNQGVGSLLMDAAEDVVKQYGDIVTLGVGLHNGYGSAQRLYIKRGYIPDGTGVWFNNENCQQYAPCQNDDSLILYLSKKLT